MHILQRYANTKTKTHVGNKIMKIVQKTSATLLARTRSRLSMYPNGNQPALPLHSPSAHPLFETLK